MMICHHCESPVSRADLEDGRDIGARVPLCAQCLDMIVWGARCDDCDTVPAAAGDTAPTCHDIRAEDARAESESGDPIIAAELANAPLCDRCGRALGPVDAMLGTAVLGTYCLRCRVDDRPAVR